MRRRVLFGIAAALLLATGVDAKPPPQIDVEPGSGDAVVYVYRNHLAPAWSYRDAAVEIDGRRVVKLPRMGCTAVRIPAGWHIIGVSWPPSLMERDTQGRDPVEVAANLEPGRRYYFNFNIEQFPTENARMVRLEWSIGEADLEAAKVAMTKCSYRRAKPGWEAGPARPKPADPKPWRRVEAPTE